MTPTEFQLKQTNYINLKGEFMTAKSEDSFKVESRIKSQKGQRNYTLILDSALKIVGESGINTLTVGNLCRVADIKRTSFYTYFQSIEHMLNELAVREFAKFEDAFQAEHPEAQWGIDRFVKTTRFVFKCVIDEPDFSPRIAGLLKYHPPSMMAFISEIRNDVNSLIETNVLHIEPEDIEPYVQLISASLVNAIYKSSSGMLAKGHARRTMILLLRAGSIDPSIIEDVLGGQDSFPY